MNADPFIPSRDAALEALRAFVPQAGTHYAHGRNTDPGPGRRGAVSRLSPYLRHRLITEEEVLRAVLAEHSPDMAGKFIAEVYWRSYWKGWLEMRPAVWHGYRAELDRAMDALNSQGGLRQKWQDACHGGTGIACFDAWAQELVATGYLHNHARMWFASIWIFTLGLPWQLGADFFLRHLLDGDPASNTLSWRWVAGLQTRGKAYQATADNIATFTNGRFTPAPGELAEAITPLDGPEPPDRLPAPQPLDIDLSKPSALLLHKDDLSPDWLLDAGLSPVVTLILPPSERATPLRMSEEVQSFRAGALLDVQQRLGPRLNHCVTCTPEQIAAAARAAGAVQIVTPYAPVGPVADALDLVEGMTLHRALRPYDAQSWPHATAGFFKFKKQIPQLLAALSEPA